MSVGFKELDDRKLKDKDHVKDQFKDVTRRAAPNPVITAETKSNFKNQFVAFSIKSDMPEWDTIGAATTRSALSNQMKPLVCGVDYYVHPIE